MRGLSGAGKTLLLRALGRSGGEVTLDGQRRDAMPAPRWRRLVAYLAAEPAWWADTIGEHFPD